MNTRLLQGAIEAVHVWLRKQDEFSRDIREYGIYYLEPPPLEVAAPTIRAFYSLQEFPWPEDRCIVFVSDAVKNGRVGRDESINFYVVDGVDRDAQRLQVGSTFYGILNRKTPHLRSNKLTTLFRGGLLQQLDYSAAALPPITDEFIDQIYDCSMRSAKTRPTNEFLRQIILTGAHGWLLLTDDLFESDDPHDPSLWTESAHVVAHGGTIGFLWSMSPLVTPTGYRVTTRPRPFGPHHLRKSFANKPIFSIINHDRLYRMYEASKPQEEGDIPRFTPLHHRRRHVRHLWSKAGIRLRDLPREPDKRQLLVLERNVPRVMVKDCWVGSRQFTLDGFDFEVEDAADE